MNDGAALGDVRPGSPGGVEGEAVGAATSGAVEAPAPVLALSEAGEPDPPLPAALAGLPPEAPERIEGLLAAVADAGGIDAAVRAIRAFLGLKHVSYVAARYGHDPERDPYVRTTLPPLWIARYLFMEYWKIDPVLRRGFRHRAPVSWSELEAAEPASARFFADARAHGVGADGLVVPLTNAHDQRGMLSVSTDLEPGRFAAARRGLVRALLQAGQVVHARAVHEIHGDAPPPPKLSPREREVLGWIGEGKEVPDIAIITGLSEHTVRTYLKSARLKLDCGTKAQAVVKAERLALLGKEAD